MASLAQAQTQRDEEDTAAVAEEDGEFGPLAISKLEVPLCARVRDRSLTP